MATTEAKGMKISLEIDDLEEAENLRRGLILAKQNVDSEYLTDLIDGVNAVIAKLRS
jgi:hypothetical protein